MASSSATPPRSKSATPSSSNSTVANSQRKLRKRRFDRSRVTDHCKLFFVGGRNFQNCEKGFLRDIDLADALHALLAFFLFFEELAFARDVAAVAFGENVFANRRHRFARNHAAANRGLDRHFKQLPWNQFSQAGDEVAGALVGMVAVAN